MEKGLWTAGIEVDQMQKGYGPQEGEITAEKRLWTAGRGGNREWKKGYGQQVEEKTQWKECYGQQL